MDPVTGYLVGAGINAGSNAIGNMLGWLSNRQSNRENERLMNQQNQFNLQMWRMNNEYNSPAAQMARLRAAGINPALAYAQGGVQNTAGSQPEAADTPQMRSFNPQPFQMDPAGLANSIAQSDVSRAQAELFRAQAADLLGETPEAKARIAERQKLLDKYQSEMDLNSQRIKESVAQVELLGEKGKTEVRNRLHVDFEEQMRSAEFERDSEHVAALIRNLDSSTSKNYADAAMLREQTKWIAERAAAELLGISLDNAAKQQDLTKGELEIMSLVVDVVKGDLSLESAVLRLNEEKYFANLKDADVIYRGLNALANIIRLGISGSVSAVSK